MRKMTITTLLASTLLLGGCAQTGLEGLGGNPMAGILGSVLGTQNAGNSNDNFQRAAVNACGNQASQYGQVSISDVDQTSNSNVRVEGRISANNYNYQQRSFTCSFRSDGRITDFRMG